MKNLGWIILVAVLPATLPAQNRLDSLGRKTGPWRVEYPDGTPLYEGSFSEGVPVGEMVRYYENGKVRSRLDFIPGTGRSNAILYYENGNKAAEGQYINRQKDSLWVYFSMQDERVVSREHYREGMQHGPSVRYYASGQVADSLGWEEGNREGPWIRYFENGAVRLRGSYRNNLLEGPYTVYYNDSTLMMKGQYRSGQSTGTWSYFDPRGELLFDLEYREGSPVDREKYLRILQDTLLNVDPTEGASPGKLF